MSNVRIMIVEDEFILAMCMITDLNGIGYENCELVTSGEDAIISAEQEKPDVVLMDIILCGEINGIEAAGKIRTLYDIPIIFVTGSEDEGVKALAETVEPVEYFNKPVKLVDLKLAIDKAVSKKTHMVS